MEVLYSYNPVIALRHGAIDNGFLTFFLGSLVKGMFKLFTGDVELLKSLHEVTQTTECYRTTVYYYSS